MTKRKDLENRVEEQWIPSMALPDELSEQFARQLVRVRSPTLAFECANWAVNGSEHPNPRAMAFKLMRDENLHKRVGYLREQIYLEVKVTAQTVAAELDQAAEMAAELNDPDVMIKAIVAKARVMGLDQIRDPGDKAAPVTSVKVEIVDRSKTPE